MSLVTLMCWAVADVIGSVEDVLLSGVVTGNAIFVNSICTFEHLLI